MKFDHSKEFNRFILTGNTWTEDLEAFRVFWQGLKVPEGKKFVEVTIDTSSKRSIVMNDLSHCFYTEIADRKSIQYNEARALCKRDFGHEIMREMGASGESERCKAAKAQAWVWDQILPKLTYEKQLIFFAFETESTACTSLLTNKFFSEYLNRVQRYYAEQGIVLKSINEVGTNETKPAKT